MSQTFARYLVAVDGSERAMDTVRYVARVLDPQKAAVTLFHVMPTLPESYWDLTRGAAARPRLVEVQAWQLAQERLVAEFMDEAVGLLSKAGFDQDRLESKVSPLAVGVTRDIAAEAEKGYTALITGRRGMNAFREVVLGSTCQKLVGQMREMPLMVVGKATPNPGRVLAAVDASQGSWRALEFLAWALAGRQVSVTLFHAVRDMSVRPSWAEGLFNSVDRESLAELAQAETESERQAMTDFFGRARDMLGQAGISKDRVFSRVVTDVGSRAKAIVTEARSMRFGTIVVGRRGLSEVSDYPIGRVSYKVLQMARGLATWVIP